LVLTFYSNTIISTSELSLSKIDFDIPYQCEGEDRPQAGAKIHRVKVEFLGTVQVSELIAYLTSTNMSTTYLAKSDVVQSLNIILGFQPKSDPAILSVGANRHYAINETREVQNLSGGLEAFRGYLISVRAATSRLLVNVQVKHVACYEAVPLRRLIQLYTDANGKRLVELDKFLQKLRVEVLHITKSNDAGQKIPYIKTIFGLATTKDGSGLQKPPIVARFGAGSNGVQVFLSSPQQAGEYVTVTSYFRRMYNKVVQDPDIPVVNVGNRQNPSYLPVDACIVLRGQPTTTKLSPSQTQQMITFAVRKPVQNATSITTKGVQVLGIGGEPNTTLRRFNLSVAPHLISVPARVLLGPPVQYRNSKATNARFGSWNMQSMQFSKPMTLPHWSYVWISMRNIRDPWESHDQLRTTVDLFRRNLKLNGLNADNLISPGLDLKIDGGDMMQDGAAIELTFDKFLRHPKKPTLMLVILPKADTVVYNHIKRLGDVKTGVHTICVVAPKFAKQTPDNNAQYFANVALKVNLKLGGINQTLNSKSLGVVGEGKTMIVGLDVTHPSPDSHHLAPSIAGIVATVDKELTQWPADLRIQTPRQEMIDNLDEMFGSRLQLWLGKNKALPDNILIYRDGVSEGQYQTVLDVELPQIRAACKKFYPAIDSKNGFPNITIIVVGKRHNTRFYPTNVEDADRSSNPQNGTVVDRGVTEARNWDFFLQAHTALQGTARPAHYYVILDEIFRKRKLQAPYQNTADALEELTHNLCYLFGRATKAVSICPAAYYADLLCDRARRYLSEVFGALSAASSAGSDAGDGPVANPTAIEVHPNLKNTMFYI
jgi:eukaryotic translation initiation factor 2C